MYRYNNYISKHLIHSTLLIVFSLTSIVWLTQALRFISFIVNQGVDISTFLTLTTMLLPMLLLLILPPAFFCAVLFTYHKLKMESELVVMQAVGLSFWNLAKPALQVAAVVTLICYAIAFYVQPVTYKKFRDMQQFLRNNYASILLQEGVFSNPVDGLTVFIRERDENNILHGILVDDSRQPGSSITMMAEEGELVQTEQGPRFFLRKGNRQEIRNGRLSFLNFTSYTLDISLYTTAMDRPHKDPRELSMTELFTYDDRFSKLENNRRLAEGYQRIIWPGYVIVLTLLALAVLLTGQFNRRGHWRKLVLAVLVASGILFAAVGWRGMMSNNPSIVVAAWFNLLLPAIASAWLLHNGLPGSIQRLWRRKT